MHEIWRAGSYWSMFLSYRAKLVFQFLANLERSQRPFWVSQMHNDLGSCFLMIKKRNNKVSLTYLKRLRRHAHLNINIK